MILMDDKIKVKMIWVGWMKDYVDVMRIVCVSVDLVKVVMRIIWRIVVWKSMEVDREIGIECLVENLNVRCNVRKMEEE